MEHEHSQMLLSTSPIGSRELVSHKRHVVPSRFYRGIVDEKMMSLMGTSLMSYATHLYRGIDTKTETK